MPIVSIFFGTVIRMYHDDHPPPHFHAGYQGFAAFVRILDGEIIDGEIIDGETIEGSLPKKAAKLVKQWAPDHQAELLANWQRGEDPVADGDDPRSGA